MSTTLIEKRTKVLQFYETFIEKYILKDLAILQSIKPDTATGLGGCTIPTAMTIISSIELLGFLLNEKGVTGESKNNITKFIKYEKESFFPSYYTDDAIEKIYNYRHGMMHDFFPKFKGKFAGICKNETNSSLFLSHSIAGETEESLNVTVLTNDFIKAATILKEFLEKTEDESILDTILKGLKDLDYYMEISPTITTRTTTPPGTPQNK